MPRIKDIIDLPLDIQAQSDRPFDLAIVDKTIRAVEKIKRVTGDIKGGADGTTGERDDNAHNHGYGRHEFYPTFRSKDLLEKEELLGKHIRKQIVCMGSGKGYLFRLTGQMIDGYDDTNIYWPGVKITFGSPIFFPGPGTTHLVFKIGCRSSQEVAFDVLFHPFEIDENVYYSSSWTEVGALSSGSLTWITVQVPVKPYQWYEPGLWIAARGLSELDIKYPDLYIHELRIYEAFNGGDYGVGFLADIHQTDLHKIGKKNIPGVPTP